MFAKKHHPRLFSLRRLRARPTTSTFAGFSALASRFETGQRSFSRRRRTFGNPPSEKIEGEGENAGATIPANREAFTALRNGIHLQPGGSDFAFLCMKSQPFVSSRSPLPPLGIRRVACTGVCASSFPRTQFTVRIRFHMTLSFFPIFLSLFFVCLFVSFKSGISQCHSRADKRETQFVSKRRLDTEAVGFRRHQNRHLRGNRESMAMRQNGKGCFCLSPPLSMMTEAKTRKNTTKSRSR